MRTLKNLLVAGALIVGSGLGYNSKEVDAQYPIVPFSQLPPIAEVYPIGPSIYPSIQPILPQVIPLPSTPQYPLYPPLLPTPLPLSPRHDLMDEVKGTGWKEVSEIVPIGEKSDNSKGDYFRIGKDGWEYEIVDREGNKRWVRKIKKRITYPYDRNKLKIIDEKGSTFIFRVNRDRTKGSLTFADKVMNYERYFPKPENDKMIPIPKDSFPQTPNLSNNLMQAIWWTEWKEISEQVPIGEKPDSSVGDYISFGKNWEIDFVDSNKHKRGHIDAFSNPKKNLLQIYDGSEWYSLHFNTSRDKMNMIKESGKIIKYKKK